jgi:DNA-binding NarL/FixJ family response regulator/signal transduction histidine kinase
MTRDAILTSYRECLEESRDPVTHHGPSQDRLIVSGSEIIADMAASVQAGRVLIDVRCKVRDSAIGEAPTRSQLGPADALRAARMFFSVVVNSLAREVSADPELLPSFVIGIMALNESLSMRLEEFNAAYPDYPLYDVDQAHLDERRRIARGLHDQLGEGLSAALRQLELHELGSRERTPGTAPRTAMARGFLVEAMDKLRAALSDLRQDPVKSLEKALTDYLESRPTDAYVQLRISGDETHASPTVIQESYFIIREAIRNALTHGAAELALIWVNFTPEELRASVDDDGRGFVPADRHDTGTASIASMRERATRIGGRLTISSTPSQGTRVELVVPLHDSAINEQAEPATVLIVDDHPRAREALCRILETQDGIRVVGQAGDSATAMAMAAAEQPDVILLDIEIPGTDPTTTVRLLQDSCPGCRVIIVSTYEDPRLVRDLLAAGIRGYLLKSTRWQELVAAILTVMADEDRIVLGVSRQSLRVPPQEPPAQLLSSREHEVLALVSQALSNGQIASRLSITEATVKRHLRNIFAKLGAVSRIDAVNKAGAMTPPDRAPWASRREEGTGTLREPDVGVISPDLLNSIAGEH